jgi:trimeric autotransporter adhesin
VKPILRLPLSRSASAQGSSWPGFVLLTALMVAGLNAVAQNAPAATPARPTPEPVSAPAAAAAGGEIAGTVKAGNVPLPGVTISASNTLTGQKVITSTDTAGNFLLQVPSNGRYVVRAEMAAFAPSTKEALINAANRSAKLDLEMQLISRAQAAAQQQQSQLQQRAAGGSGGFQNLSVAGADLGGIAAGDGGGAMASGGMSSGAGADPGMPSLPQPGLSADAPTESVAVSGNMGRSENFGNNLDDLRERITEEIRQRAQRGEFGAGAGNIQINMGGPGGGGPPGGGGMMIMMGGPGGGGTPFAIGGNGRFNVNKPHGMVFYSLGDSIFDARPYSLTGQVAAKPEYMQNRFGASIGGPLNIPHIYKGGTSTFYFASYTGGRASNPFDAFATVPTLAERTGDFSQTTVGGLPVSIFDPVTHLPFGNSQIPNGRIDSAAAALLSFIPKPNQTGTVQNFHFVSANSNNNDALTFRLIHNFGATQQRNQGQRQGQGQGGRAGAGGGRGGGGGGGRGGRFNGPRNNLNVGFTLFNSSSDILNTFPSISGKTSARGINANIGWNRNIGKLMNNARINFNRNRIETGNIYAGVQDVESSLGINGVSRNPFDWGLPTLSLTHYNGMRDITPLLRRDQTWSFSDSLIHTHGKHSWRFGGDFRRIQLNSQTDQNARGSFVFTGFATAAQVAGVPVSGTGYDFADFLLGLPQQTSAQFGVNSYYFRGNSWDLFVQDDWKVRSNLTLNLGLRYEYVSPLSEKFNRLVNLDAAPLFTAVAPVQPGQTGPFTGEFPKGLVNPDRNNFAPRVGIAWKPFSKTVVRSGYGINYNTGAYNSIVQQMAFQPPFAFTQTSIASAITSLTLQNGFPAVAPGTVTNNFGADRNYRLGYVQNWNLGIQHEITKTLILNADYTGAKGTRLDIVRAPNRGPLGLRIAGVQPFTWQSSEGASILHSGDLRLRKRMSHGLALGGSYTFSKSLDNASSIGGGATVVAQNDLDLAAERGLSSFDVRHRLNIDYVYELPVGTNKHWLSGAGWKSKVLGDWQWSGGVNIASGSPFTPRVLGDFSDVARGTNGTLRASVTGQPVALDDPTVSEFFNTAAFVAPPRGQFGNARRNSIEGPGTILFDMSVSKSITLKDTQGIEFRLQANNVFNTPRFAGIDTTVNSASYGRVISAGSMRKVQIFMRYRF